MPSITTANRSRAADAVVARANNGSLRIYGGTPPADANAALSGNTLLAVLPMSATAFAPAAAGVATANAITADSSADATGRPTFARLLESDGTTVVAQLRCALAWLASTAYSVGDLATNGANTYRCTTAGTSTASGGPSGTGTGIADGTTVWAFDGPNEVALTGGASIIAGGTVSVTSLTCSQAGS
jgi:hypothetical protein